MASDAAAVLLEAAARAAATGDGDAAVLAAVAAGKQAAFEESQKAGEKAGEAGPPPEDLKLRELLQVFTEAREAEAARKDLVNAGKILRRLSEDTSNTKLHVMRRDVLVRMVGEPLLFAFEAAGFVSQDVGGAETPTDEASPDAPAAVPAFRWSNTEESASALARALHEVQRAGDLLLDPDTVSFAQVSELVQQNRTLPGIEDVNDAVPTPLPPKDSSMDRPRKPWEK
mmetsp:Transcript_63304/g.182054  ORF Transcript_63304/g.182054 Transcript_63304/m.182054 type:complete len:228 (-) Transcript_63304:94-777(-)